ATSRRSSVSVSAIWRGSVGVRSPTSVLPSPSAVSGEDRTGGALFSVRMVVEPPARTRQCRLGDDDLVRAHDQIEREVVFGHRNDTGIDDLTGVDGGDHLRARADEAVFDRQSELQIRVTTAFPQASP